MGNALKLYILFCLVLQLYGFRYDEGCISQSKLDFEETKLKYNTFGWPWSEVHIGAWVPKSFSTRVLDISIDYKDKLHHEANGNIMIYRNKTELTIGNQDGNDTHPMFDHPTIPSSWAGFIFRINSQFIGIYKLDDDQQLFNLTLSGDIGNIVIKGSNLTINCQQGFPIWWISNKNRTVPLDSSTRSYNFTLYSTSQFTPAFKFGKQDLKFDKQDLKIFLGISNITNEISAVKFDRELPAHTHHDISIICETDPGNHSVKCEILNSNSNMIYHFSLPKYPEHITVFKDKGDSEDYMVTLHQQKLLEYGGTSANLDYIHYVLIGSLVLLIAIIFSLAIVIVVIKKNKEKVNGENLSSTEQEKDPLLDVKVKKKVFIMNFISFPKCISRPTSLTKGNQSALLTQQKPMTRGVGAMQDSLNLDSTFKKLGYEVCLRNDLNEKYTNTLLDEIQKDVTLGFILLFIMSHGLDRDTFYTSDGVAFSLEDIQYRFTDKNCPHLLGMPKIIISDFCRGLNIERIEKDAMAFNKVAKRDETPHHMITVNASHEGFAANRSTIKGTLFIYYLCMVLNERPNLPILDAINQTYVQLGEEFGETHSQTPEIKISVPFVNFKF